MELKKTVKAVQMIQLGTVMGSEEKAKETMQLMKDAGYDGIELDGVLRRPEAGRCLGHVVRV